MSKKLIDTMNQIETHGMCLIIAKTEVKILKKGRGTKREVPSFLEGLTKYYEIVASVGNSYSNAVKNQITKAGGNASEWEDEECRYSERDPESTNGIVRRHKTKHEEKYVRYYQELMGPTHGKSFYLNAHGDEVTGQITPEIEAEFFADWVAQPSLKQSEVMAKQEIALQKEVKPRNLKAENLIFLKKGEVVYSENVDENIIDMFILLNNGKNKMAV